MRAIWIAIVIGGCGNAAPQGSGARDQVVALWKKDGLEVSTFSPLATGVGKDCANGTVNKVDMLVCNFATAERIVTRSTPTAARSIRSSSSSRAERRH
ncbi:MAG TPA: hypothetical protein VF403_27700 [Kofleriaceae bacterium]